MGIGTSLKKLRKKADIGKVEKKVARYDKKLENSIGMGPISAAKSVVGLAELPADKDLYKQTESGVKAFGNLLDENKFAIIGAYAGGFKGAAVGAGADKKGILTWKDDDDDDGILAPPIALPDEELTRTSRRKNRARRRGGRSASILTGGVLG